MSLILAALAAFIYGGGSVLQAIGARRVARAGGRTAEVARELPYLAGLLFDLVAWLLSLAALRSLPVFVVEAVLAGSVAVTEVLAAVVLHSRLRRQDIGALVIVVGALALVGASAGSDGPAAVDGARRVGLLAAAPVLVLVAWLVIRRYGPIVLGGVAGLAFGGCSLCARAAAVPHSFADIVSDPLVWGVIVYGLLGIVLYARALGHGHVGPVTAALWVTQVIVPAAIGVAVLGDRVRHGWLVPALVGVAGATAATVVLARSPAQSALG